MKLGLPIVSTLRLRDKASVSGVVNRADEPRRRWEDQFWEDILLKATKVVVLLVNFGSGRWWDE